VAIEKVVGALFILVGLVTAVTTHQLQVVPRNRFRSFAIRIIFMGNETQKPATPSTPNPSPGQQHQGGQKPASDKPGGQQK
jgi:hypothetical protein